MCYTTTEGITLCYAERSLECLATTCICGMPEGIHTEMCDAFLDRDGFDIAAYNVYLRHILRIEFTTNVSFESAAKIVREEFETIGVPIDKLNTWDNALWIRTSE